MHIQVLQPVQKRLLQNGRVYASNQRGTVLGVVQRRQRPQPFPGDLNTASGIVHQVQDILHSAAECLRRHRPHQPHVKRLLVRPIGNQPCQHLRWQQIHHAGAVSRHPRFAHGRQGQHFLRIFIQNHQRGLPLHGQRADKRPRLLGMAGAHQPPERRVFCRQFHNTLGPAAHHHPALLHP